MKQDTKLTQLCQILMVTIVFASDEYFPTSLPGCKNKCGNVTIPYPFGISTSSIPNHGNCFLEEKFNLTCEDDTKLTTGSLEVLNISILEGHLEISFFVTGYCDSNDEYNEAYLVSNANGYIISPKANKFLTVGCNSYGYLNSIYNKEIYSTGCLTRCYHSNRNRIENGTCSGTGCCQVDIPPMMTNITIEAFDFPNSTESYGCSYSFVVKDGYYNFSVSHLDDFPYEELPLIIDWSVGTKNCKASKGEHDYACKKNSFCYDNKDIGFGYQCPYGGNPYHPDGCKGHSNVILWIFIVNKFCSWDNKFVQRRSMKGNHRDPLHLVVVNNNSMDMALIFPIGQYLQSNKLFREEVVFKRLKLSNLTLFFYSSKFKLISL